VKRIALLGATGSIGASCLDVLQRHPERFRASVLTAASRVDDLLALCQRHRPDHAVVTEESAYPALREGLARLGLPTQAHAGPAALTALAGSDACDTVVAAIVGAAGIPAVLAAAESGKRILLANKEVVVAAGDLLRDACQRGGATLLPVDSEHNAIFQCLPSPTANAGQCAEVRRIVLTASGGPFLGRQRAALSDVSPEQAVAHPNWSMGRKISVDSATLMNKGLEVIEAHWLFEVDAARIEVVVHPQSIVHSLVDYIDGSTLAQLGNPDMRTALAYGLGWPERIDAGVAPLDLVALGRLDFRAPDLDAFPALGLAFQALRAGIAATTILNAANEVAVSAFLQRKLGFLAMADVIGKTLDTVRQPAGNCLEARLALDAEARRVALGCLPRHTAVH